MRGTRQRPNSQHGASAPMPTTAQPVRKVFNCIVEDTALVAGVKKSTRNGIRQWVRNGQIKIYVPLHALEQLSRQKGVNNRHGEDVRETLQWLDEATSRYPSMVTLQGADEIFEEWAEVEKFVVPRTLFSETDGLDESEVVPEAGAGDLPTEGMSKLALTNGGRKTSVSSAASAGTRSISRSSVHSQRTSVSALSPPTSPLKADASPVKSAVGPVEQSASSSDSVPKKLQPLFNYILWRVHQEVDPVAALESFIFLCNDPSKVEFAKGFEIRTKRLEQLREAIGREDRDFKYRQMYQSRENQHPAPAAATPSQAPNSDTGEDVVHKSPPTAPAAMLGKPIQQPNVIDPDAFGRNGPRNASPAQVPVQPYPSRPYSASPQFAIRGQAPTFAPRGMPRGNFRGVPRGRGNFVPGRGGFVPNNHINGANGLLPNGQIDPNSFARPRGGGYTGRGGRKLWVPT